MSPFEVQSKLNSIYRQLNKKAIGFEKAGKHSYDCSKEVGFF